MTHHHHHEVKSDLTFQEKLIKLLGHWAKHNREHAATYNEWAQKASGSGLPEIGALLKEIHALSMQIDDAFKKAADNIR